MSYFKDLLATGEIYHIYNRSIIGDKVFPDKRSLERFKETIFYYLRTNPGCSYSKKEEGKSLFQQKYDKDKRLSELIAYCIMPNHFHLILKQLDENGISVYIGRLLNSYSRYYNTRFKRKGPLWEGRFNRKRVETDEDLLHLTRYIHLNPATSYLVEDPVDYPYSSYKSYLSGADRGSIQAKKYLGSNFSPSQYKSFVLNRKDYQRYLDKIRHLLLEKT